ncbi:MAG: AIR carboxylase family protein [Candidatus Pacebacteria bacterium]|nr:AIR carboxylase family protein [Candidatus Paceibacterota bacterium]MCF7857453.1 AIR carboxylase family protein [Candidatus Paceibacterota bacterium]
MEQEERRRVLVVTGSDSDLSQCGSGSRILVSAYRDGLIDFVGQKTVSAHANHRELCVFAEELSRDGKLFVVIAGAGWAAHLPGMLDAILANDLRNSSVHVIGVGFEDKKNPRHTIAAEYSISEVPRTRVIYADDEGNFVGPYGFIRACEFAVRGKLSTLTLPVVRQTQTRSPLELIDFIEGRPS